MAFQLHPLSTRPELFERLEYGVTFTRAPPRGLLASESCRDTRGEMSIDIKGVPDAATSKLHYAGNGKLQDEVYFYTKKEGVLFFDQNYLLLKLDIVYAMYRVIRETESANVTLFHRQPYYLLRTGVLTISWEMKHFEGREETKSIDLTGVSLSDALLIYSAWTKKIFIFRKGKKEWSEVNDDVVIFQHPLLDMNCTAYSDDWDSTIYVAFSTKPELMILQAETLSVEIVLLPTILDIRHATSGQLIFYEGRELTVGQLEPKYWMPKVLLQMQLDKATKDLEMVRLREMTALGPLLKELEHIEKKDFVKENIKMRLQLAAANTKINQLTSQLPAVPRTAGTGLDSIHEERDLLVARNAELEAKYRKALLMLGREKENGQGQTSNSSVPQVSANISQSNSIRNDAATTNDLPESNKTKKKRNRNKKNKTVNE